MSLFLIFVASCSSPTASAPSQRRAVVFAWCPAGEQYHQTVVVSPEIEQASWAEINAVPRDTGSDSLHVREVALLDPGQRNSRFRGRQTI
jgi:hypothetical protein